MVTKQLLEMLSHQEILKQNTITYQYFWAIMRSGLVIAFSALETNKRLLFMKIWLTIEDEPDGYRVVYNKSGLK